MSESLLDSLWVCVWICVTAPVWGMCLVAVLDKLTNFPKRDKEFRERAKEKDRQRIKDEW